MSLNAQAIAVSGYGYGPQLIAVSGYGDIGVVPTRILSGGIGHGSKKPRIAVVTIEGQDYRVPIDKLQSFLDAQKKIAETQKVVKTKKSRKALAKSKPPKIIIKSAPPEYKMQIQASVDRTNEILRKIWEGNLTRLINEAEQEEALALVLMMED